MSLADVDLADVSPCPNCGKPVRRFATVPIAGAGVDLIRSGPWWCDACTQAKCAAAADAVRAR